MGTENTASTILAAGQLTAQANEGLSKAITYGFNQLGESIKYEADLMNKMVIATQNAKQIEIDEWYKSESLKLHDRQLSIQENHYAADLSWKKTALADEQKRSEDRRSQAPLVSLMKADLDRLDEQNKIINSDLRKSELAKYGKRLAIIDGKETEVTDPSINGFGFDTDSPEYKDYETKTKALNERLKFNTDRGSKLVSAYNGVVSGAIPPEHAFKQIYEQEIINLEQQEANSSSNSQQDYDGAEMKMTTPLFDTTNKEDREEGQIPTINSQSYDPDFASGKPVFSKELGTDEYLYENLVPKVKYLPTDRFLNTVAAWTSEAEKYKTPIPYSTIEQGLNKLEPSEKERILESRRHITGDFALSLGDNLITTAVEKKPEDSSAIKSLSEDSKKGLMSFGENPDLLNSYASEVRAVIAKAKTSPNYTELLTGNTVSKDANGNEVITPVDNPEAAQKNYLYKALNNYIATRFPVPNDKDVVKEKETVDAFASGVDEFNDQAKKEIKETFGLPSFMESTKNPERIETELKSEFAKTFLKEESLGQGSPFIGDKEFSFNKDFEGWIKKFNKPSDFGVIDFKVDPYTGETKKLDAKEVAEKANRIRNSIMNDPRKAYDFWVDKMRKEKASGSDSYKEFGWIDSSDLLN